MTELHWLAEDSQWRARLSALRGLSASSAAWAEAVALANLRMDFIRTLALDQAVQTLFAGAPPAELGAKPIRLALLGSCTMAHLHGAIRVAGLRRGLWIETYENPFGQYRQVLSDTASALHAFAPNTVLFALDAHHLAAGLSASASQAEAEAHLAERLAQIAEGWRLARETFRCPVIHQTALPVHAPLVGQNEHRLAGSRARFVAALNPELRDSADRAGVDLLSLDARVAQDGLSAWHDAGLWHRAKQEVAPKAAPMFGDLVGRLLAAQQGRSAKCLVLDLDNTLWGGVIGDDGLAGIVLGQGSPLGEAFVAFQDYARELSRRGVLLAVCSKNDEANAIEPFDSHPDMVLRRADIACFVANWSDKAANLRRIAAGLNIGLDSLVFVDDNPAERALVRRELPMVAVPEVSDDPVSYILALSDAGYFETTIVTDDDRVRGGRYQANRARDALKTSATDMDAYLRGLNMELVAKRFDAVGLPRIVQLINKTNQFNLTTRRYAEPELAAIMNDPRAIGLQLRLIDRFGDNGIVAIVIGRLAGDDFEIDAWLMSCRVFGRQIEPATLNLIAAAARMLGAKRLLGEYAPTPKNGMVRDHYERLGFVTIGTRADGGSRAALELSDFTPSETFLRVTDAEPLTTTEPPATR